MSDTAVAVELAVGMRENSPVHSIHIFPGNPVLLLSGREGEKRERDRERERGREREKGVGGVGGHASVNGFGRMG